MVTDEPKDTSQLNTDSPNNPSAAQQAADKKVKNLAKTEKSLTTKIELDKTLKIAKAAIEKELSPIINLLASKTRLTTAAQEKPVEKKSTDQTGPGSK